MAYLNQKNVFSVASAIYEEVQKQSGMNVEGYYLDDIQIVMQKLWEKNKDKSCNIENIAPLQKRIQEKGNNVNIDCYKNCLDYTRIMLKSIFEGNNSYSNILNMHLFKPFWEVSRP